MFPRARTAFRRGAASNGLTAYVIVFAKRRTKLALEGICVWEHVTLLASSDLTTVPRESHMR